jgi:hypothetical protein
MDRKTLALVLGIFFAIIGTYLALAKKHYSSETWKPTELAEKLFGQKRITRIVRFQGILFLFAGVVFILEWFGHAS